MGLHALECSVLPILTSLRDGDPIPVLVYRIIASHTLQYWEADLRALEKRGSTKVARDRSSKVCESYPDEMYAKVS